MARLTRNDRLFKALEQVERAIGDNYSRQPRFGTSSSGENLLYSAMRWVNMADTEEPPYQVDSRRRDKWLSNFWKKESHLAGVLSSVNSIDANRGWHLIGGRNQVNRYSAILKNAESGAGWRQYISLQSTAYYSTDLGSITELGRDGRSGPVRAIYHLDPTRCWLTGDPEYPLRYEGTEDPWGREDFFRMSSMRNISDDYRGLGYCAISRCLDMSKIMLAVYQHQLERLGARAPKGLLLLQNISQQQWQEAMKSRDAALDSDMRKYYQAVAVLAQEGVDAVDAKLVALSQLPDGFDLEVFTNLLMYAYALCFGYDPIEFWPVLAGQLGRGRETDIQHRKGTGKGGLNFMLAFQDQISMQIPETLIFEFEQRDQEGELLDAKVTQAWANIAVTLYGSTRHEVDLGTEEPYSGGETGVLDRNQVLSLLASHGIIPAAWAPEEDKTTATDSREPETRMLQEQLLENPSILRAIHQFPEEPIVRYSWPDHREQIIWSRGKQALERTRFGIVKPELIIPSISLNGHPQELETIS